MIALPKSIKIIQADVIDGLKSLETASVHCVVTSIPYWGLRDYEEHPDQLGQEGTIEEFLQKMVIIFEEIKRVLHFTGTVWVNVGDSYNSDRTRGTYGDQSKEGYLDHGRKRNVIPGLHKKNLIGQPWRFALAMQAAGWIWRDEIIWMKPDPMPFSATDRTTRSHEALLLFSKSPNYHYDWKVLEEVGVTGKSLRRCRSVWTIATERFASHHATYPKALVLPCVLAGSAPTVCEKCLKPISRVLEKLPEPQQNEDGYFETYKTVGFERTCKHHTANETRSVVLDPFMGTGTTGIVAANSGRNFVGIELVEKYVQLATDRIEQEISDLLFTDISVSQIEKIDFLNSLKKEEQVIENGVV